MLATLVLATFCIGEIEAILPRFSWNTLPVFFHSANSSGPYNVDALNTIAKFQMATIEKYMGCNVKNIDDEDAMVVAMKAIKAVNPTISTYFYMNAFKDRPEMTRMAREIDEHPNYYLRDKGGVKVKNFQGFYVFDLSNLDVRKWWMSTCLNATKHANGDGCFCDSSVPLKTNFTPSITDSKLQAWIEGMLNLTNEVQTALGDDKLLIGKKPNQSYVRAVQIESFSPSNNSIRLLRLAAEVGQVVQAHVPVDVPCANNLTDYIATFLIGAGKYAYFGCGLWSTEGNDTSAFIWHPEYDKPLGEPKGPAVFSNGVWTRSFASGTEVTFNPKAKKGSIKWAI